jgi:hypothetical protein
VVVLGPGEHQNTAGDFIVGIDKQVTITGAGARSSVVREVSGGDGRVFLVESGARLTISGVALTGTQSAAAVLVLSGATLDASRIWARGNSASQGAGVFQDGTNPTLSMTNVTVTGNSAPTGSGISIDTGCSGGAPISLGFNLDAGASCALAGQGDRSGADPLLGPLADNGGGTDTMALGPGSPAIDAGGNCPPPATDQRGIARPLGAACDVGAFEAAAAPLPPVGVQLTKLRVKRVTRRRLRVSYLLDQDARVRFRLIATPAGGSAVSRAFRPRPFRP